MKSKSVSILSLLIVNISCITHSANMRIGTDRSYVSLKDQRDAALSIQEFIVAPEGSSVIGKVDASRCHRNGSQLPPTEEDIKLDLKIAAYSIGADGIINITISKQSGLSENCWHILTGEAVAIKFKKH